MMSISIVFMIIVAALLHALWNSLVKIQADRLITMTMITTGSSIVCISILPFIAMPDISVLPYMLLSLLLHNAYYFTLIHAYSHGDFGYVYPITRGSIPLFVAIMSYWILGELLSFSQYLGLILVASAIFCLLFLSGRSALKDKKAALYAISAAFLVAGYTIVDGLGARLNGDAHSYTFWLFAFDSVLLTITAIISKRRGFITALKANAKTGLMAGVVAMISTWLVIWALTLSPMAIVSALRETSVIFSIVISYFILRENVKITQIIAVLLTVTGAILLNF